tara:strand:- start:570 stop:3176 length:2607 start_codon:yes stop_codon:yes gene_type:complete
MSNSSAFWFANPGGDFYNNVIDRSLRLDGSTGYLMKTYSADASSTNKFALSMWIKITDPVTTGDRMLASSFDGATVMFYLQYVGSTKTFRIYIDPSSSGSNELIRNATDGTGQVFRDPTNWYHIALIVDMTLSGNENKAKLYVNGNLLSTVDSSSTGTPTTQNIIKNGTTFYFSRYFTSAQYFSGYYADIHLIDGAAAHTDFAETKNGVWIPKAYGGSYGNNGARLQFLQTGDGQTSPSSSTIGADTSGLSTPNHFKDVNLDVGDVVLDTPENNFCTLNPLKAGDINDMSQGALQYADNRSGGTGNAFGIFGLSSGKWYWEVHYDYDPGASNMIGIVAVDGIKGAHTAQDPNSSYQTYFAWDERGLYYQATDDSHSNTSGHTSYAAGDIISFAMDVDAGKLFMRKNNSAWEDSGDPVNGTNPSFTFTANTVMSALVTNYRSSRHVFNFGQDPTFNTDTGITAGTETDSGGVGLFKYAPPTDYLAMCTKNLPNPTIGPNSDTQVTDHFNIFTYTGTNGTNRNLALNTFTPDLAWVKARTTADNNVLVDSSRVTGTHLDSSAVYPNLHSNNLDAEASDSHPKIIENGIQVSGGLYDNNGINFVVWTWKANGGTTTTNNAGSNGADITGVIQANTTAGFSIVTFTGDGASGTNNLIAHGLGKKPAFYIVKDRDTNIYGRWMVYHHGLGLHHGATRDNLFLELTNFSNNQGFGSSDDNTSVLFEPAVTSYTNVNGNENIAYLWAQIDGFSKFGSYAGNGLTNNFIHLGFRPKLLVIKRVDSTSVLHNWYVVDSERSGVFNATDFSDILCWDKDFVEGTLDSGAGAASVSGAYIDLLAHGFNCKTSSTGFNNSSGKYVYMAWAEQPFKLSNAK